MAGRAYDGITDTEYRRRIRAWTIYDWANSAFATTVLGAVLPIYFAQVAGATLPTEATATRYYTTAASIALLVVAVISPILGTMADIGRRKKRFLAGSVTLGVIATASLPLAGRGDWLPAALLLVLGQIGFATGNVFYDSLLPHVARPPDQDRVSTRGYAFGYLGGGLLLAANAVMIFVAGEEAGARLSFLSVAVWWAVFSIPILTRVPEPPAATMEEGGSALRRTITRLRQTFGHLRSYRQLFRFLVAFLVYNDGINTIILVAVIYGIELGFPPELLILALLLVQFAGIPFSLIFGRIPDPTESRRTTFLAFVLFNLVALPLIGIVGARTLDADVVGRPGDPFETVDGFVGEGEYEVGDGDAIVLDGPFDVGGDPVVASTSAPAASVQFAYNGREVIFRYAAGPDRSEWIVSVDGRLIDEDGEVVDVDEAPRLDGYNEKERFGEELRIDPGEAGRHTLIVSNTAERNEDSAGTVLAVEGFEVLEPTREAGLVTLLGLLALIQLAGWAFAATVGRRLVAGLAETLDTKRTLFLSLTVYSVVAVWGFFLDTVIEFWFLAWMIAMVQGGSQALSRSLYASLSPSRKSGEFFGFFSIMSKFSAILGPLLFAVAVAVFDNSRPAVLGIAAFFIVGALLLRRVDVEEGRAVAQAEDQAG